MLAYHLARFKIDATPPMGHPLCGGWIKPVEAVDDPLWLRGVVIQGAGLPIVLAAIDWTGIGNDSHRIFCQLLAQAAQTTTDRVALHTVHQHNAPFVDRQANELLNKAKADPRIYSDRFVDDLMEQAMDVVKTSLSDAKPFNQVRVGASKVGQVACNRRVIGPDGKIKFTRTSATKDPVARAEPEGTIDPILRSLSFCQGDTPLARLYYYTTHPMSYYGDGRVSADFVGIARQYRERDEQDVLHVYFTGAAGNVTAGKYNDGAKSNRVILAGRVYTAMRAADIVGETRRFPVEEIRWKTSEILFPPREDLDLDALKAIIADDKRPTVDRNRNAMTCSWLIRSAEKRPIMLSRLDIGKDATLLHLPGETFVEYQLAAQALDPTRNLFTAAYGDDGPWYIPQERSYAEGGYEPSQSFVSPKSEAIYIEAITSLLKG